MTSTHRIESRQVDLALLVLIVFTLPLEFTKQYFPVQWLEITRVLMAIGLLRLGWHVLHREWLPVPMAIWLAVAAVAVIDVGSWLTTRWDNGLIEAASIILYPAFGLFVSQTVRSRRDLTVAAVALCASGAYVAMVSIAQQVGDFYIWRGEDLEVLGRRNSTFRDPNITARMLLLAWIALLATVGSVRQIPLTSRTWILGLAATSLYGAALVLTLSRFGWLFAIVLAVIWLFVGLLTSRRLVGVVAAFGFGVVGGILLNSNAVPRAGDVPDIVQPSPLASGSAGTKPGVSETPLGSTLDDVLDRLPLDDTRRYLIRAGIAMFADHPVAGVGLGGAQPMLLGPYYRYIPPERRAEPTSLIHTEIVRIAAETGVLGLASYAAFVLVVWLHLWRALSIAGSRVAVVGAAAGFGLLLVASQAEGRFYDEPYLWLLIGVLASEPLWHRDGRRLTPGSEGRPAA
jgi:hypothetical protein